MITESDVLGALSGVRDPELDEPLTELGFVSSVEVLGSKVFVRLRLPTYFCAPNFSYLMASDAKSAVELLPGVDEVQVRLQDHFAENEINDAVAGKALADAFGTQSGEDVDSLRTLFMRKAFLARQGRLCELLLRRGHSHQDLEAMSIRDLPDCEETSVYLSRRLEAGITCEPTDPAFVMPHGALIERGGLERQLRYARMVRISVEGNAGFCRSVLKARYGITDPEEVRS
jgi:metal-sulfur cluster biosynthetic enzyme